MTDSDDDVRLSSEDWCDRLGVVVRDPDGWDRKNFQSSWDELITQSEFERRCFTSTLMDRGRLSRPATERPFRYDVV